MSAAERRRRRLAPTLLFAVAIVLLVLFGATSRGVGDETSPLPSAQPWLGVIDGGGTLIDASPGEAPGEVWSLGNNRMLRYTDAEGWTALPAPLDASGSPVDHLTGAGSPLAGRATRDGAVALLANEALFVRDPGGSFHAAPSPSEVEDVPAQRVAVGPAVATTPVPANDSPPPETESVTEPVTAPEAEGEAPAAPEEADADAATALEAATPPLHDGERLYDSAPLLAPLRQDDGHAGAFVVPTAGADGARDAVLQFDGEAWSREPICLGVAPACDVPSRSFSVVAIDAAGGDHAWLLASDSSSEAGLILLHRAFEGGDPVWRPVSLGASPFAQRAPSVAAGTTVRVTPRTLGQPLVVTARGVWADAAVSVGSARPADATLFYDLEAQRVLASWCDLGGEAGAALCTKPLGSPLPSGGGRSFAWDDGSAYGSRVITGLNQGAMLRLSGEAFERVPTAGRSAGGVRGAAFAAADDGWLGSVLAPVRFGSVPEVGRLRLWPVPFRHPLTAVAAEPGKPVGAIDAQALAVGDQGEVARYLPGQGWSPETLYGTTGARATPRLRGVAWPTPDSAYAVGDHGEMWQWRRATGLWEPDPAKPPTPSAAVANFTGIAFDPGDPGRGYAIGKQGVLLSYDKEWTQEPLPGGLGDANFSSIAFAGDEAIVTYKTPIQTATDRGYRGGIIVNDGSGWREDTSIAAQLPAPDSRGSGLTVAGAGSVPERVAGLPDGGAVVATMDGHLAERDSTTAAWQAVGLEAVGYPVALGALREAGALRAVVSVDTGGASGIGLLATDVDTILNPAPPGQAPVLLDPYPIATGGYVLRQTAGGWHDEQHEAWPDQSDFPNYDLPEHPDPVLAFLVDPLGRAGWAVGGDPTVQTASVARYPDDGQAPPGAATAPATVDPGEATFAIGGGAECLGPCADLQPVGAGPWRWLPAAVAGAGRIGGVRAFLDTGAGTAGPGASDDFAAEQSAAARRLTSAAGMLPVYAAPAPTDRDAAGSLDTFLGGFGVASAPLGSGPAPGIVPVDSARSGHTFYAFDSTGQAGTVRVVVLDTSESSLGEEQGCWLAAQLSSAATQATPTIAVGNRPISELGDAAAVAATLASGAAPAGCALPGAPAAASAYFYDAPEANRLGTISAGADAIPAFGTGSLGYIGQPLSFVTNKPANSGFLLAQVDVAQRDPATNRAPVSVRLIPNIAELAVDATDGTQLGRGQVGLFEGLARRPRAGQGCREGPSCQIVPLDPYVPIPVDCVGPGCDTTIAPEYSFSSSDPSIADFVARDPVSTNPRRLRFDPAGRPIADSSSGLLCGFNAGTTTVTLTTGGLSYSMPVTVEPGKAQRPCGTVPVHGSLNPSLGGVALPAFQQPQPGPGLSEGPTSLPPPAPPVPAATPAATPTPVAKPPPPPPTPAPFLPLPTNITPLVPIVPPPPPPVAQTTPPSGTSPVTQPVPSPNPEDEEEVAFDLVHHMAAHRTAARPGISLAPAEASGAHGPSPYLVGALILMVALAGSSLAATRRKPQLERAHQTAPRRPQR